MDANKQTNPWLAPHRAEQQARLRLFCFPYAGGSASIYGRWPQSLPTFLDVCAVQLPGRGGRLREKPFSNLTDLVPAAAEGLLPYMDRPFAFFGHSMGALVAFELARHLRKTGVERMPAQLFLSGCRAPQLVSTNDIISNLPDQEFIAEIRRLNGTPAEVLDNPELMQLLLPLLRADCAITETYSYQDEPPLDCPLTIFGGAEDEDVRSESLSAWRGHTAAAFSLRILPGDHFFLHTSQATLLETIARELRRLAGTFS